MLGGAVCDDAENGRREDELALSFVELAVLVICCGDRDVATRTNSSRLPSKDVAEVVPARDDAVAFADTIADASIEAVG